ncbi:zinc ribbon domain-containing protein [Diaphorobacter ruginosibacter]|uniref:Zinc ribbon domain-containing protein n=1 Tax=Diaphorobacter ruginosibacter TaxID=1715720 RepID=A0A7G9RIJ5_9BURK|nr:zinc ribbon domain-containing protein [Diaphorobacter ruginosibacter]QNN55420.1 zinc ribbon domain-containing protein [Diaphorobacter ruginosibacter]
MNESRYQSIDFGALTRAGEGLTQWRALGMGFLTALACGVIFWLMQVSMLRMGGAIGGLLTFVLAVLAFVVWVAGASAVGVLLMDKARNVPQRSLSEAAMFGLGSVPKFLLLGIAVVLVSIAFMLVAALIYFICKVPVIGAVLAFVAHPLLVLIASAFIIACVWVVFPLFAPAVWSGLSFRQALASVFAIARNRLVQVVLMMMVLYIILAVIGMLIMSGVFPAAGALTAAATGILGGGGYSAFGGHSAFSPMMGMFSNASLAGAMLGMSLLGLLLFALVALVAIMGMNVLYLQASSGLDTAGTESDIEGAFGVMREKAREAADKARAAADRAKQAATERVEAAAAAREAEAAEVAQREEEQSRLRVQEQEERQAAARAEAEREARARAEAQRQAAAREVAQSQPSAAPASPAAPSASGPAAGMLGSVAAAAAAASSGDVPAADSSKACKACGHRIGADDLFCENCGTRQ